MEMLRPKLRAAAVAIPLLVLVGLSAQNKPDYAREIRPIFENSCYGCHGEKVQSGGLRLDQKQSAIPKLTAIQERISGTGSKARMPLGGAPLSAAQINLVKAWIDSGADWPDTPLTGIAPKKKHWAFVPPVRPAAPIVKDARWARNPIDRFVLAKLEAEALNPSPEAPKATLLRRLSLDLTGLPPTPEEVDAFLKDNSPRAYEKQVDRLLASPHYGEKWARQWLDGARYADSDGYEKDKPRLVWAYRDYVINAFNKNLPYNQFVTEQIAGDLLPNATQDQKVATGFLRNSMINEEGGVDPEQFRMEAMFDRMDAVGKNILGVTIQCSQCHTHKYDPIQHEDYYRLFAFLNNSDEGSMAVYTPAEQAKIADIRRRLKSLEKPVSEDTADPRWTVVRPEVDDISTGGQRYLPQPDGSLLAQGYAPTKHNVKLTIKTPLKSVGSIRLELLTDPNLPLGGPGRSIKGTGALSEIKVEAAPMNDAAAKPAEIKIAKATADINLPETPLEPMFADKSNKKRTTGPIEFAVDGVEETAWGIDAGPGRRNQPREAVFNLATPITNEEGSVIIVYLKQNAGGWNSDDNQNNNLGRIRLSFAAEPNLQARAPKPTTPEIEALWKEYPEGSSQLVLHERATPRETHLLTRGDFLQPAKVVTPGVPAFLNPLPQTETLNRLALAKWLVARDAPTPARSYVNRIWQAYFGIGIVETAEDLGTQSSPASHPELLDWLAVEFMDRNWDVKAIHRLIVTSATYRQLSNVTPELEARDPYNRLLARGPRFRVESEIVRDIALAASGLLDGKIGGPSVNPPSPAFLYLPPTSYGPKVWNESKGSERYRRALYTFRFRSVPYPMLQAFDSPTGDSSCVRRARSNTPLQALTTLNEPLFLEAAKALAAKTQAEGGADDTHRLNFMYKRVLSREPSKPEATELLAVAGKHGWTVVARVLLNLDETITKE
ncbi:MAG: Protein of unknown function (DUF1553)/Protein of unknown function (DUF1549)/Planctomycete [Bryobacterales bacterium]|nr:Protein of unknown function (DUF1553)/Protein of unknown function (DUF1549)/Planctomycete [Bryobacterales bacterium]